VAGDRDVKADRNLMDDLERALFAHADHADYQRLDRELAAAFRGYGRDLDSLDPGAAGACLAGRPSTPEIAAAIDEWCRVRRTRLEVDTWRHLADVARAADPDPWRNARRDQFGRQAADALPALRARAAAAQALEKQPVNSLLLLAIMLTEADHRPTAAAVLRVAKRRSPDHFWVCLLQGTLDEAIANYREAIRLKPDFAEACYNLGSVLSEQGKVEEAEDALAEAIRLNADLDPQQ
jgi:tetratricopeptide (TPR) repeat protein